MENLPKTFTDEPEIREQDTQTTYQIGKTKVFVTRIFRTKNAETLDEILVKLINNDFEKS